MKLRIVSGFCGGRFIEAPRGRQTRPTSERVREAWLSAVGREVVDATVVDLFAGSGALGIEALSRGARHVHFVETSRTALATLRSNIEALGLTDRSTVVGKDAFDWIDSEPGRRDLAFADPPYSGDVAARLVAVWRQRIFATCLWVEHAAAEDVGGGVSHGGGPCWTRRYGDSRVSRFCSTDEDAKED